METRADTAGARESTEARVDTAPSIMPTGLEIQAENRNFRDPESIAKVRGMGSRIGALRNRAGDRTKKECRNIAKASPNAGIRNGA